MALRILLAHEAEKALMRIDATTRRRVNARIQELADAPRDPRLSKPLQADPRVRSARVGEWRILFSIDPAGDVLNVLAVRPRGKAYRDL